MQCPETRPKKGKYDLIATDGCMGAEDWRQSTHIWIEPNEFYNCVYLLEELIGIHRLIGYDGDFAIVFNEHKFCLPSKIYRGVTQYASRN